MCKTGEYYLITTEECVTDCPCSFVQHHNICTQSKLTFVTVWIAIMIPTTGLDAFKLSPVERQEIVISSNITNGSLVATLYLLVNYTEYQQHSNELDITTYYYNDYYDYYYIGYYGYLYYCYCGFYHYYIYYYHDILFEARFGNDSSDDPESTCTAGGATYLILPINIYLSSPALRALGESQLEVSVRWRNKYKYNRIVLKIKSGKDIHNILL